MRYRDKATIKQVTTHQNKPETNYYGHMTDRQRKRMRERWLKDFRIKVTDKIWWDSLSDNDKTEVATDYKQFKDGTNNLKQLMIEYPGDKVYIRETKLSLLV
jgi:hypothetical protein